jgi:hypothetical protein
VRPDSYVDKTISRALERFALDGLGQAKADDINRDCQGSEGGCYTHLDCPQIKFHTTDDILRKLCVHRYLFVSISKAHMFNHYTFRPCQSIVMGVASERRNHWLALDRIA